MQERDFADVNYFIKIQLPTERFQYFSSFMSPFLKTKRHSRPILELRVPCAYGVEDNFQFSRQSGQVGDYAPFNLF